MSRHFTRLDDLRRELLGYTADFVADATDIALARLTAIEAEGARPTIAECLALSEIYGVEPRHLARRPLDIVPMHGVSVLAQSPEFQGISQETRAAIARAATVARQVVELEERLGRPGRFQQLNRSFRHMPPPPRRGGAPYQEGRHYAETARRTLKLRGPIKSMRDFMATHFPAILVLYASLGDDTLGGVALADARRGPTIILNIDGRNENPLVRRFSLGHELCHVLVDWNRMQALALISAIREDARIEIESRANAFAVRLLFPERVALSLRDATPRDALRRALHHWGLHDQAARLYLQHAAGFKPADLDRAAKAIDEPDWHAREESPALRGFPVDAVPPERRTTLTLLASRAFAEAVIDRGAFARLLGLRAPPDDALRAVLVHAGVEAQLADERLEAERRRRPLRDTPLRLGPDFDAPLPEWEGAFGP